MQKFVIKQKFWALGDTFTIFDDQDRPVYFVKGKAFSVGDKLSFQDMNGNELAFINQILWSWKRRYEIFIGGNLFAEMVKEITWKGRDFTLDLPGPNDVSIKGEFWKYNFDFLRNGVSVAKVHKPFMKIPDTYMVEIENEEDVVPFLCACIVIDQVCFDEE